MKDKWWKNSYLVIPLLALIVGIISIPYWPALWSGLFNDQSEQKEQNTAATIATSPINIKDIIERIKIAKTTKDAEDLLDTYRETPIFGAGEYSNEWKPRESWGPQIGITISNKIVRCNFNPDWEKKIKLHQLGDTINFLGTFRFIEFGVIYYVDDCSLTK